MEGLGNCYVFTEALKVKNINLPRLAISISDITRGIGADGLIVIDTAKEPYSMRIFNSDGSEAELCGNGLRQAALFLKRIKYSNRKKFIIKTVAGEYWTEILSTKDNWASVKSTLGSPDFRSQSVGLKKKVDIALDINLFRAQNRVFKADCICLGNPHAVIWVDDFDFDWPKIGHAVSRHSMFRKGINVHFCRIINRRRFQMKIYERGSGATQACGSGAGACLTDGVMRNLLSKNAIAEMPGGNLKLNWNIDINTIIQEGPVSIICSGEYVI
jgi:diaminopimelate epimerase